MSNLRRFKMWLCNLMGYDGDIATIKLNKLTTATLRASGWVIISDGRSSDALPLTFCSDEIVSKFGKLLGVKNDNQIPR